MFRRSYVKSLPIQWRRTVRKAESIRKGVDWRIESPEKCQTTTHTLALSRTLVHARTSLARYYLKSVKNKTWTRAMEKRKAKTKMKEKRQEKGHKNGQKKRKRNSFIFFQNRVVPSVLRYLVDVRSQV